MLVLVFELIEFIADCSQYLVLLLTPKWKMMQGSIAGRYGRLGAGLQGWAGFYGCCADITIMTCYCCVNWPTSIFWSLLTDSLQPNIQKLYSIQPNQSGTQDLHRCELPELDQLFHDSKDLFI